MELEGAIKFHGHLCFGLCVGFRASKLALEYLGMEKSKDEELFVIAENRSCAVDAIQCVAGATAGRGNLLIKDFGKHAYAFASREKKRALRIVLRYESFSGINDQKSRIKKILDADGEDVFNVGEVKIKIPPVARVEVSVQCHNCKEPVMKTRTRTKNKKPFCTSCYEKVYIQSSGKRTSEE
jgi:formylmethanofuran dehydrogenase subunit E